VDSYGNDRNKFCVKAENSEIRQKTVQKGKNSKNPLLLTKILKLLYGQFFTIWAQKYFSVLKKSTYQINI
jgi:hypothetical protein